MLTLINPIVRHATHKFKFSKIQSLQMNRIKMPLQRDKSVLIPALFALDGPTPPFYRMGNDARIGNHMITRAKGFAKSR